MFAGKKGSRYGKPRKINPDKFNVNLNEIQKDIIAGTLLGDASIEKGKPNHNSRIRFDQTFPMHASYITSLYTAFLNLTGKHPVVNIRKEDKRTGKVYSSISFKTLRFPCLNEYYNIFYKDGKKIVPYNIAEMLNARALAYWIMDDGGKGSGGETNLHTRAFTIDEVKLLQKALNDNFSLNTRVAFGA